jgi:HAD superfamily hydrolase (TIGR01549 family)
MIKAVLLDLDNTLLHNPDRQFALEFMQAIDSHFKQTTNINNVSALFRKGIQALSSHRDMMLTNTQVMGKIISDATDTSTEHIQETLFSFYNTQYLNLERQTSPIAHTQQLIDQLLAQDIAVAIVTNPIYPQFAILERLEWAGLSSYINEFSFITHSDNMHFSKPHPAYYAEVIARIGLEFDEALMVGDSEANDIQPARRVGLHTFHITESNTLDKLSEHIHTQNWQHQHLQKPLAPDMIIPQYEGNLGALFGLLAEVKENQWIQRPDQNEWSIIQILYHLQQSEASVQRHRLQTILDEENPFIVSQPPPGPELETCNASGFHIANQFRLERLTTIQLLSSLNMNQWQRPARHSIFGMTTLLEMAHFTAQHDRLHISQLCQTLGKCS